MHAHTALSYESSLYGFKKLRAEDILTASLFPPTNKVTLKLLKVKEKVFTSLPQLNEAILVVFKILLKHQHYISHSIFLRYATT